jgi:hypothetical protein
MHKNATKCNKTQSKWFINKHGASKIIDTFEAYQGHSGSSSPIQSFFGDWQQPLFCVSFVSPLHPLGNA